MSLYYMLYYVLEYLRGFFSFYKFFCCFVDACEVRANL